MDLFNVSSPTYTDPVRYSAVFNTENTPVNPFGLMRVTGLRDDDVLEIGYPNAEDQTSLLVNGSTPIPAKDYGQASFSFPAVVAYDQAGASPVIGEQLGTVPGKWNLQRGQQGFQVMARQAGNTVTRVLVDKRFGLGGEWIDFKGCFLDADVTLTSTPAAIDPVTTWKRTNLASTEVVPTFPSEGLWLVKFNVSGRIKMSATSGQTPQPISLGVQLYAYSGCEMVAPVSELVYGSNVWGMVAHAYATDDTGAYSGQGTCTVVGMFQTSQPNAQIAISTYPSGALPGNIIEQTIISNFVHNSFSMPVTHCLMLRLDH